MSRRLIYSWLTLLLIFFVLACSKNSNKDDENHGLSPLEIQADLLHKFVLNQYFIPVDFYSLHPIDYNQDDAVIDSLTDLRQFILQYLTDDKIVFQDDSLDVDQGRNIYPLMPKKFKLGWEIKTSKASNLVYIQYMNYTYESRRYTLDNFDDTSMLLHVLWKSEINSADTATVYTRYIKK